MSVEQLKSLVLNSYENLFSFFFIELYLRNRKNDYNVVCQVVSNCHVLTVVYLVAVEMARVASEVKAGDIKVLFVKPLVYWTRFFIIATGFSRPQVDAIGYEICHWSFNIYLPILEDFLCCELVIKAEYIYFYLCCILGLESEIELRRNMEKFQLETQNPTHGPCWTLVSNFTGILNISNCILYFILLILRSFIPIEMIRIIPSDYWWHFILLYLQWSVLILKS